MSDSFSQKKRKKEEEDVRFKSFELTKWKRTTEYENEKIQIFCNSNYCYKLIDLTCFEFVNDDIITKLIT
jgi:hypothetical protein